MKKFRKVLVVCVLFLNGCAVSGKVWDSRYYDEKFKGFAVADDQKIVLVGEAFNPNPSLAKNSLMTVIRNAASIDKAFSYVS